MKHMGMQSIPTPGGSGGVPPGNFKKITLSEIESEGIFHPLFLWTQVHKTSLNALSACLSMQVAS